jgi:AAA domain
LNPSSDDLERFFESNPDSGTVRPFPASEAEDPERVLGVGASTGGGTSIGYPTTTMPGGSAGGHGLSWAVQVVPRAVSWVPGAEGLLPRRIVGLLGGPRNIGKSLAATTLAGDVTRAGGYVWINSLEDDLNSVVRPRCEVAGVVLDRARLSANRYQFPDDLPEFRQELQRHADEGRTDAMVVLDSLQQHLPKYIASEAAIETMQTLKVIAEEFGLCILLVGHLTKTHGDTVESAIGGAGAIQNMAKLILLFGPQPDTPQDQVALMLGEDRPTLRVLAAERLGVGPLPPSRLYRLDSRRYEATDRGEPFLEYLGTSTVTSLQVLDALRRHATGPDRDESKQVRAAAWIVRTLEEHGPMPTRTLEGRAREAGMFFSQTTCDRAKSLAEAVSIAPNQLEAVLGPNRYATLGDERHVHWVRSGWTGAPLPGAAAEPEDGGKSRSRSDDGGA